MSGVMGPQDVADARRALDQWFDSQGMTDIERLGIMATTASWVFVRGIKAGTIRRSALGTWIAQIKKHVVKEW